MATASVGVRPAPETPPGDRGGPRRRSVRRLLRVAAILGLLLALVGVLVNVVLVGRLERIDDAFAGLTDRPPADAGQTFLVVGTRPGGTGGPDVPWLEGLQSVEAVMLVEVAPDGRTARVETLPGSSDVAPAAASTRSSDTVAAAESWSGRRADHLIAIDWDTLVRLAELNGVDPTYTYGSEPAAQHAFLQRVTEGTLHAEMRKQPLDLLRALLTTTDGTAVDDDWSVLGLDRLVFSLRNLRSHEVSWSTSRPR